MLACSSPHLTAKVSTASQQLETSNSHSQAPSDKRCSTLSLGGPSAMFESVGTLAYHGVSCFSQSKPSVATKIRFVSTLFVCPVISASLTALLSVYITKAFEIASPQTWKAQKSAQNSHAKMVVFFWEGFNDCNRSQVNCLEKNCVGLPVGSKSTAPMPEKMPSEDGSYEASVWRNHTLFEVGRSSRGLLNSRSFEMQTQGHCHNCFLIQLWGVATISMHGHHWQSALCDSSKDVSGSKLQTPSQHDASVDASYGHPTTWPTKVKG